VPARTEEQVGQAPLALQRVDESADHADEFAGAGELLEFGDLALAGGEQETEPDFIITELQQQACRPVGQGAAATLGRMIVLGIESSCDETGVALVESTGTGVPVLRAHALHSQIDMHQAYGGVVPELASRDHIRRVLPLAEQVLAASGCALADVDVVAYTRGPGLAGALLVGAGVACALGSALGRPVLGVHHLEGHLLSPFLSSDPPEFPFIALLVSGGHTQLMQVDGVGRTAAGRDHRRRGRRGLRQVGQAAGPGLSGRAGAVAAGASRATRRLQAAAAAAAQRRPRLLLRRPEDGRADAGAQAGRRAASAQGRPRGLHRGGDRRGAGEEIAAALDRSGLQRIVVAGGVGANRGCARSSTLPAPSGGCGCTTRNCPCAPTTAP
jgi:N6-L-threonylcarbamoyladenine synthase